MTDFNLERELADWRRTVLTTHSPSEADLAELESGLHDRYEEYLLRGHTPTAAFARAREHVTPDLNLADRAEARGASLPTLLVNYAKVGLRNLRARAAYNLVNYLSLAAGIATVTLGLLYLDYETTYDRSVPQADRKFRVAMNLRSQGYSMVSFPDFYDADRAGQLQQLAGMVAVPGVEQGVQFGHFPEAVAAEANDRDLPLSDYLETNTPAEFLDFFGSEMLLGTPAGFAAQPGTALLTASTAARYFGPAWRDGDLLGRDLEVDTVRYLIVGVVADPPPNNHFSYSVLLHRERIDYWGARVYLRLAAGVTPEAVTAGLRQNLGTINPAKADDELFGGYFLQPLRSIHLGSDLLYELKPPGRAVYLYIIGMLALVLLLLTVSNYANLAVLMNAGRAREVGMRKIFGAGRGQVAGQFLLEALLLSLLSLPLILLLLWVLLPGFNELMGVELPVAPWSDPGVLLVLLCAAVVVGLLAGSFPAWSLARTPVQVLFRHRGGRVAPGRSSVRKVIITLQFALLIGLCSLTLFVNRQLAFIQQKDLGYERARLLYVPLNADSARYAAFRTEVLRLPNVTGIGSGTPMGQNPYNQSTYRLRGTEEVFDDAHNIYLDYDALRQLGVRTSVPNYVTDPATAPARLTLINETLADRLRNRFKLTDEELVGRTLIQEPEFTNPETGQVGFPYLIGGTFEDLHLFSLRERVEPMFLSINRNPRYVYIAAVSYRDASPGEMKEQLRERYEALGFPGLFTATSLEQNLAKLYVEEQRIATLVNNFSLLALLLAIVGLGALAAYLTAARGREIAVRRILGARRRDLLVQLNAEYLLPLGIATLVAVPLAWYGVAYWLGGFAYRIAITPLVFGTGLLAVAVVTGLAVSVVTLRVMGALPARSLGGD